MGDNNYYLCFGCHNEFKGKDAVPAEWSIFECPFCGHGYFWKNPDGRKIPVRGLYMVDGFKAVKEQ